MVNSEESIATSLSISCVYYDTTQEIFEQTLASISKAIYFAKQQQIIGNTVIYLINNNEKATTTFFECIGKYKSSLEQIIIHSGHGNIGYGRANNIAINQTTCDYHLILNPDVITAEDAIAIGIEYLNSNPEVGLVAPHATNLKGETEYLAKRTPTFLVILLRGLNIQILNRIFKNALNRYAYKEKIPSDKPFDIELASGCFMLFRSDLLKVTGGFSTKYFLYFEDFDLSQKVAKLSSLRYLPTLKIIHSGGKTSTKGIKHIVVFLKSALIFLKTK